MADAKSRSGIPMAADKRCTPATHQALMRQTTVFLATLFEAEETFMEESTYTPMDGGEQVTVLFHHPDSGRMPRVTFYPRR